VAKIANPSVKHSASAAPTNDSIFRMIILPRYFYAVGSR
jgi:hypothetical protein